MDIAKKKILIVSRSFYPMVSPRSFRTTELVKEFAHQGYKVTLLTVKNEDYHISFEKEYGVTIKDFGPLRFPKVKPGKNGLLNRIGWIAQRVLGLLFEYPDIELVFKVKRALELEKNYDLMVSIAVPHPVHWGVALARNSEHRIAKTWVADCGDPYMGFKMDRFNKPFYFKYLEKHFCRKADFISVPIEEAKEAYYAEFRNKIEVIPQGFKFDEIKSNGALSKNNEIPVFAYAGNLLGGGRNPHELLDFLVKQERPFKFIIYTRKPGPVRPYMKQADRSIEIRDYIPRKELLEELAEMDFLVNLENDTSRQVPSKLIDYYLAGRPVLSVPSKGLDKGKVADFLKGDYSDKYNFGDMRQYRIENVCKRFLELCERKELT